MEKRTCRVKNPSVETYAIKEDAHLQLRKDLVLIQSINQVPGYFFVLFCKSQAKCCLVPSTDLAEICLLGHLYQKNPQFSQKYC